MHQVTHQIVVGIIRRDDKILLVEQQGPGDPASTWTLPGGRVESGELLPEALAREIAEETGIVVREIGRLAYIAQFDNPNPEALIGANTPGDGYLAITFVFEIRDWSGELHSVDPDGFILQARFLPLADAITKLNYIPLRVMREPIVTYLRGEANAGTMWFYRRQQNGTDDLLLRLNTED